MSDDTKTTKRELDQSDSTDNNTPIKTPRTDDDASITTTPARRRGPGMFGVLLGTLDKIHSNNETDQDRIRQRQALDAKLQARLLQEKDELEAQARQEEAERAEARAQRQSERNAQRPVQIAAYQQQRAHFLLTETTTPALAYLPKRLVPEQQERLDRQLDEAAKGLETAKNTLAATVKE